MTFVSLLRMICAMHFLRFDAGSRTFFNDYCSMSSTTAAKTAAKSTGSHSRLVKTRARRVESGERPVGVRQDLMKWGRRRPCLGGVRLLGCAVGVITGDNPNVTALARAHPQFHVPESSWDFILTCNGGGDTARRTCTFKRDHQALRNRKSGRMTRPPRMITLPRRHAGIPLSGHRVSSLVRHQA
jgi:hypothetical protein